MTEFGPWKIWNGGECPVPADANVQVQSAKQTRLEVEENPYIREAIYWFWRGTGTPGSIIAYREVIEPVVETVEQMGSVYRGIISGKWLMTPYRESADFNGTATVTLHDGKPVRMVWEADQ